MVPAADRVGCGRAPANCQCRRPSPCSCRAARLCARADCQCRACLRAPADCQCRARLRAPTEPPVSVLLPTFDYGCKVPWSAVGPSRTETGPPETPHQSGDGRLPEFHRDRQKESGTEDEHARIYWIRIRKYLN